MLVAGIPLERSGSALIIDVQSYVLSACPEQPTTAYETGPAQGPALAQECALDGEGHDEFEEGVTTALSYAATLGCTMLNCLAGVVPAGVDERRAREAFIRNLRYAAPRLSAAGVRLLVEPINTRDIPGFFLTTTRQAIDLIAEVGSDNLYLQYDIYHMQIMEGDLAKTIERYLPQIAHMQLADPPGRHQPGTGEISFPFLLDFIDRLGYTGWIGCEYKPLGRTEDSLAWTRRFLEPVSTEG